jgi:hypothetical protein
MGMGGPNGQMGGPMGGPMGPMGPPGNMMQGYQGWGTPPQTTGYPGLCTAFLWLGVCNLGVCICFIQAIVAVC